MAAAVVVDVDHLYLVRHGSQSVGCIVHSAGVDYKADLPRPCEVGFLPILLVETFFIYFLSKYFTNNKKTIIRSIDVMYDSHVCWFRKKSHLLHSIK